MVNRFMLVVVAMVLAVVVLGGTGSANEIFFEDDFDGDSLGEHWEVNLRANSIFPHYNAESPAKYHVDNGRLTIDAPVGDTYFDLKGYSLEGNLTVEIGFRFSSDRSAGPGNFMLYFHRPQDYISWWDSDGIVVSVRRFDLMMSVAYSQNITELDMWEVLWGSDIYDTDHVLKVKIEDGVLYPYMNDEEILLVDGEFGVSVQDFVHGGFSLTVYDSLISFDYIKVYR